MSELDKRLPYYHHDVDFNRYPFIDTEYLEMYIEPDGDEQRVGFKIKMGDLEAEGYTRTDKHTHIATVYQRVYEAANRSMKRAVYRRVFKMEELNG